MEKLERANVDPKGFSYFSYASDELGTVFVFLSSRKPRSETQELLKELSLAAYAQFDMRRTVGVATQNMASSKRWYDFLLIKDVDLANRDELRKRAKEVFRAPEEKSVDIWGNRYSP